MRKEVLDVPSPSASPALQGWDRTLDEQNLCELYWILGIDSVGNHPLMMLIICALVNLGVPWYVRAASGRSDLFIQYGINARTGEYDCFHLCKRKMVFSKTSTH